MPFEKGHKLSQGRPKKSKNTLPIIRDRLFRVLLGRLKEDKKLEGVDTATLIKFASACLPKDMSLAITKDPNITYISNVPRPELSANANNECVPINQPANNQHNIGVDAQVVDNTIVNNI